MHRTIVISCAMMLSGMAFGQSQRQTALVPMFHVQGTIEGMTNGALPRVEVSFASKNISQSVIVDDKGFYQIDLPVGTYTMSAALPPIGPNHVSALTKYVRFFRVQSPTIVTLNGALYGDYSCDGVWAGKDENEQKEDYRDACGGEDSFPFPSKDGVPLSLDIRYVRRARTDVLVSYSSNTVVRRPVVVTYNLFALQADSVDYDRTGGTIRAYGNIIFEDQPGQTHAGSAAFKFDDGKAIRIR